MRIPKRLLQIYRLAQGDELWDIGCDHSILARINMREGKFSRVYCVDKSKSSLQKIVGETENVDRDKVILIESDGCLLDWKMVKGSVVIAGVGGNTVLKIIESCPPLYRRQITWILNPFTSVDKFLKEIVRFLPGPVFDKHEAKENGRVRYIFRYPATE